MINSIGDFHCTYCSCPKEVWSAMRSYPSDRCCEFYDDVCSIACDLLDEKDVVSSKELLKACWHLQEKYPDLMNLEAAIFECFDAFEETKCFETERG